MPHGDLSDQIRSLPLSIYSFVFPINCSPFIYRTLLLLKDDLFVINFGLSKLAKYR